MTQSSARPKIRYTPGPYYVVKDHESVDDYWVIRAQADHTIIASMIFWDCDPAENDQKLANAILLKSAPEMIALLRKFTRQPGKREKKLIEQAKQLIHTVDYVVDEIYSLSSASPSHEPDECPS